MTTAPPKRLLVCVDFSEVTDAVVAQAQSLATLTDATVRVLHVAAPDPDFVGFEAGPDTVRHQVALSLREEHAKLERIAERLRSEGIAATPMMVQGSTVATILAQARRFEADLIVLGSHGHGALFHLIAGSVTEGVLREGGFSVLVVPAKGRATSAGH
jgi:nucleotide-binding universal stress UspA family protein